VGAVETQLDPFHIMVLVAVAVACWDGVLTAF